MRSDYALYTVAVIFFILTALVLAYQVEYIQLWTVTTVVLGLLFIGLGYTQRPKPKPAVVEQLPPAPIATTETVREEILAKVEVPPPAMELTKVKGIKEKRAEQLKAVGINNVDDLAKASANDLAVKLKISPKITGRWIESAKKLTAEKS